MKQGDGFVVHVERGPLDGERKIVVKPKKPRPRLDTQMIYSSLFLGTFGKGYERRMPKGDPPPRAAKKATSKEQGRRGMRSDEDQTVRMTLSYREGTSDKVYVVELVERGAGYVVEVAYGRRGRKLTEGTKTPKPLPYVKAFEIYMELVSEKLAKGYRPSAPEDPNAAPRGAKAGAATPKDPSWDHPKLGRFKHDGMGWVRTVDAPGFKAAGFGGRAKKCELTFSTDDETELPSAAAVAVAEKVIANLPAVATAAKRAMWDDVCGRAPDSGMYWHGDMEQLVQGLDDFDGEPTPPKSAEKLAALMSPSGITIHKDVDGYNKPIAELSFAADFEEEHGVGILTDGKAIIGIGYMSDATPFKKSKRR